MLDPNWFYSSLAQSAAAIVGLLGGIFAGRLQEQITASREERLKSIDVLRDLHRRLAPFRGHLEIYLQHADAQIALLESELSQGRKTMHRPVWYAPTGIGNLNIEVSEQTIQVEKEQTREAKVLFPLVVAALDKNSATGVYDLHDAFFDASISALPKTIGEVSNLRAVMGNTHRQLKILELRSRTRPSWMLWICLLGLGVFGVVLPLWFLSAHATWHKIVLLGAFATILTLFLGYLASQIKSWGWLLTGNQCSRRTILTSDRRV